MKVLVVDDNENLAGLIKMTFENEGMEVMSAKDGKEGYTTYGIFKPDLVITDIQMPKANGLEMMANIRVDNPMVKTIYMSGDINAFRPLLEGEKKRYPVSFFEKPFSLKSLLKYVLEPATSWPMGNAVAL